jgi:hypothetical protein
MAVLIPKQIELISQMCARVPIKYQLAASNTGQPRLDSTELGTWASRLSFFVKVMTVIARQGGKRQRLATINKSFPSRKGYVSTPYLKDPVPL